MFTVSMYCSRMMAKSMRIGLVVDCTALDIEDFEPLPSSRSSASSQFDKRTKYWHNQNEWDEFDIEFQRLSPPKDTECGDGDPLAPKMLTEFHKIVSMFLQKNRGRATYIALFDSRGGLGAASYLAAAYMCKSLKAPVHMAVEAVKEATPLQPDPNDAMLAKRKWGICDVRLIKDLQVRFKGRKAITLDGKVPRWWWAIGPDEDADDESDEGGHEANAEGGHIDGKKRPRDEESITIPPCTDDNARSAAATKKARHGDDAAAAASYPQIPSQILEPLQRGSSRWTRAVTVVGQLTQTEPLSSIASVIKPEIDSSADVSNFQPIKSDPDLFQVTWASTRSRRGFLLILSEAVYFLEQQQNESIDISCVKNMKFPRADLTKRQHRTLIDVVLVKDVDQGASVFRFYALDLLFIDGGMVHHKPLDQRLRYLKDGVLIPRKKDEARGGEGHAYAKELIKIRSKDYFQISKLGFVLKDVCSGVSHEANGIKFVPAGEYGLGNEKGIVAPTLTWQRGGRVPGDKLIDFLCR